jgi:hypothetical protein
MTIGGGASNNAVGNSGWAISTEVTCSAKSGQEHVALAALMVRPGNALADGQGARDNIWSFYTELRDQTNQPSNVSGPMVGYEHDLFCGNDDPGNNRIIHAMGFGREKPTDTIARVGRGSVIGCADSNPGNGGYTDVTTQSYLGRGYCVICPWDSAAFDCSEGYARSGAPAYRMGEAMAISFAADDKPQLKHTASALRYYYNGAEIVNFSDTGTMSVGGSIVLQESNAVVFTSDSKSQLKHTANALRYYYNGAEIFNFGDTGGLGVAGGLSVSSTLASVGLKYTKSWQLASGYDLDTLTEAGFYDGASLVHAPTGDWYYIEVLTHSNTPTYCVQRATGLSSNRDIYMRQKAGASWSAWQLIPQWGIDFTFKDITASRGDGSGVVYLGGTSHYLYYDNTKYNMSNGGLSVGGDITAAGLLVTTGTASGVQLSDRSGGTPTWTLYDNGGVLRVFRSDSGDLFQFNTPYFAPGSDGGIATGQASLRWSTVYAASGTINTSDAREKTGVTPLSDAELAWAKDLAKEVGSFQFLDSIAKKGKDSARHHLGMTVQRAIELGQAHGLDPTRYAFICYDTWEAEPEVTESVLDSAGEPTGEIRVLSPARPAGDRYSFRTDQLALFIAAGQETRLAALEATTA